jgi:hypothetical protein
MGATAMKHDETRHSLLKVLCGLSMLACIMNLQHCHGILTISF